MSLYDRLETVRRNTGGAPVTSSTPSAGLVPTVRRTDPFAAVKASVHQALLDSLGPQLYDPNLEQAELDQRVRQTLQLVIDAEQTPLSSADRTRIAQEVSDEILGHGPLEPYLRDQEGVSRDHLVIAGDLSDVIAGNAGSLLSTRRPFSIRKKGPLPTPSITHFS